MCPPERSRSGVSIPNIHALRAGNERQMRPYGATRAGTQAPPLPISTIFFHAIPYKQNSHLHAIHPNGMHKQSTHTSGAEMHRALPPPLLKIKKCVYRYSFGITGDDIICFKTSYSLGVTVAEPWPLPPGLFPPGLPEPPPLPELPLPEPLPLPPLPEPPLPEPPFFLPSFFALGTSDSFTCTNFLRLTFAQMLDE